MPDMLIAMEPVATAGLTNVIFNPGEDVEYYVNMVRPVVEAYRVFVMFGYANEVSQIFKALLELGIDFRWKPHALVQQSLCCRLTVHPCGLQHRVHPHRGHRG